MLNLIHDQMSYAQFQESWEQAAAAEYSMYRSRSPRDLLADITCGLYGNYNQIWYALEGRTTFKSAHAILLRVLRSNADYLVRYHCAALLLSLFNPYPDVLKPMKLSARDFCDVDRHLLEYEQAAKAAKLLES